VKPAAAKTASSVSVILNNVVIINSCNKINRTTRSYTRERKCRDKFLLSWLFAGDIDPRRFELQFWLRSMSPRPPESSG
jgi:hypothetical protein